MKWKKGNRFLTKWKSFSPETHRFWSVLAHGWIFDEIFDLCLILEQLGVLKDFKKSITALVYVLAVAGKSKVSWSVLTLYYFSDVGICFLENVETTTGFLWPVFPCIKTESTIPSLYGKIQIRENLHCGIFYAVKMAQSDQPPSPSHLSALREITLKGRYLKDVCIAQKSST